MRTGTKFWLAVGILAAMVALLAIYLFRPEKPEGEIVLGLLGVITLVAGGYFTANVAASGQTSKDPPQ